MTQAHIHCVFLTPSLHTFAHHGLQLCVSQKSTYYSTPNSNSKRRFTSSLQVVILLADVIFVTSSTTSPSVKLFPFG